MEMSGPLHTLATLSLETDLWYPLNRSWVGTQNKFGCFPPQLGIKPQIFGHPPHSLVTIRTTQSQIQHRVLEFYSFCGFFLVFSYFSPGWWSYVWHCIFWKSVMVQILCREKHACMFAQSECQHIFILRASGLSCFPSTTTIYISGRGGECLCMCLIYILLQV